MAVCAAAGAVAGLHHPEQYSSYHPYDCDPYYSYTSDPEPALPRNAPPPSYESLFGKMKTAKSESHSIADFVLRLFGGLIAGAVGLVLIVIFVGLTLVIPVAMAVIGFLHIDDCPEQRYIPLYLIVGGIGSLIYQLLSCTDQVRSKIHKWMSSKTCENEAIVTNAVVDTPAVEGTEDGTCGPSHEGHAGPTSVAIPDSTGGDAATKQDAKKLRASQRPMACFETLICLFMFIWFICGNVWVYGLYAKGPVTAEQCHPLVFTFTFWLITGTYIFIGSVVVLLCLCGCLFTSAGK